jgi:putative peptide zinc metalloprotease protein
VLGGEVHEMGIMLLVLTPVPYVDASSVIAFSNKWKRILVGAIGIGAELFMASLALIVWVNLEPGPFRSLFYNIILIAGISSILFNGNPLLRYDGYYVLSDLLEIPNLGQRGIQYLGYLAQYYLFGVRDVEPPPSTPARGMVRGLHGTVVFLPHTDLHSHHTVHSGKFLTVGLLLALWAVVSMWACPCFRAGRFLTLLPGSARGAGGP